MNKIKKYRISTKVVDCIVIVTLSIACVFLKQDSYLALIYYITLRILYVLEKVWKRLGIYDDVFIEIERKERQK